MPESEVFKSSNRFTNEYYDDSLNLWDSLEHMPDEDIDDDSQTEALNEGEDFDESGLNIEELDEDFDDEDEEDFDDF